MSGSVPTTITATELYALIERLNARADSALLRNEPEQASDLRLAGRLIGALLRSGVIRAPISLDGGSPPTGGLSSAWRWRPSQLQLVKGASLCPLAFAEDSRAEATEEAILNALCMAETMIGKDSRTIYALPLDRLQHVMQRYRPS